MKLKELLLKFPDRIIVEIVSCNKEENTAKTVAEGLIRQLLWLDLNYYLFHTVHNCDIEIDQDMDGSVDVRLIVYIVPPKRKEDEKK